MACSPHAPTQLEIGWGKRVQVELKRELGASFGVCIVGGTVTKSQIIKNSCSYTSVTLSRHACILYSLHCAFACGPKSVREKKLKKLTIKRKKISNLN